MDSSIDIEICKRLGASKSTNVMTNGSAPAGNICDRAMQAMREYYEREIEESWLRRNSW